MKNIKITIRLTNHQLARSLQTMKQLDPNYQLTSLNGMVKTIYHDYLAKMSLNKASEVPMNFITEISSYLNAANNKLTIENLFSANESPAKVQGVYRLDSLSAIDPDIEEDGYDPQ